MQDETLAQRDMAVDTSPLDIDLGPQVDPNEAVEADAPGRNVDAIFGVKLDVRVVLGRTRLPISDVLGFSKGSVIELDRKVGDPVEVMVNDRMVARGDLVKVQGDLIGVALREIVKDYIPGR